MASSHHHHHTTHQQTHHTHQLNPCNCTSCCPPCCNSTSCNSLPPPPPPLQSNPSDQLLQALATSLLLQSQPQPQPQNQPYSQFQTPIPSSIPPIPVPHPVPFYYSQDHLASNQYQYPHPFPFPHKTHHHHHPPPSHKSNEPLASLFDRVAALESSLFSNPTAKPATTPVPPPKPSCCANHETHPKPYISNRPLSLKDLAARTIQLHFRQYLVRRSQILRDLKRLAVMKCHVSAVRSAVSHRSEIDPKKVQDQAADLLLQLDFIRSADPMIYEGKRAIEKELVRIIEFVDKIFLREREIYLKETNGKIEEEEDDDDSGEQEKKPKKKVSFEERSNRFKAENSDRQFKEAFAGHSGGPFQIPKEVFELGDELEFDKMEGPLGRKVGQRGGDSSAPSAAQNEARKFEERR